MKVFFDTVGCRLNQAEIDEMAGKLRQAGHEIVSRAEEADTVIINSCAVTAAASSDSRQKVRQAHGKGVKNIILTGCWATLYPKQAGELAGVTSIVDNLSKMDIPAQLIGEDELIDMEPIARRPIPGVHHRTRAFIKIQDGCDNYCTYCVTRIARGKAVSISKTEILNHLNKEAAQPVTIASSQAKAARSRMSLLPLYSIPYSGGMCSSLLPDPTEPCR